MRMDDTLENRQNNEFEALRSIYCDDVKDLRTNTKCDSLDFIINLKPQRGSNIEVYVQIDLHVKCSPQYPNEIPQIFLEKNKGIPSLLVDQLHQELLNLANACLGNEMFLQLCEHIQEFLYKHNKPGFESFYDEMCQRKKLEEMKSQKAKELEKDKERKIFSEEVERRYSTLEQEKYRKKSNSVTVEENVISRQNSALSNRRKSSSNDSSEEFLCFHKRSGIIFFENNGPREIIRGNCLRHTSYFRSVYCGIDKETGEYFIVNEWRVPVSDVDTQVNKQVQNIEREFKKMKSIKHANLTPYINFSWNIDDDHLVIYILRQFVDGMNCRSLFVNADIKVDITVMKYIAIGVLRALNSLHEKDIIHRSVKDTCIYINNEGIVKVSNFNIHRKLTDLFNNTSTAAYGKKVDVFKFGLVLLGLIQGKTLTEDDDISIPDSLQSDLHDFLTKCLSEDEKYRFSVSQLLDHQFCSQKPAVEFPLDQKLIDINQELDLHNDALQDHIRDGSRNQSRIRNEFEFIESIGEGAFGTVCKYRNKLDSQFYAIKKIKLNPRDKQLNKKTVREVKLLSRLNHENVVRYYNSWIESEIVDGDSSETGSSDDFATSKKLEEFTVSDNVEDLAPPAINTKVSITYDSKSQVTYEDSSDSDSSEDDEDNNDCTKSYNKESESDGIEFQNSKGTTVGGDKESSRSDDENQSQSVVRIDSMYIQMEFCEKSTLKSAIDDNLYLDETRMLRLFREILEGLAHIHKQGMIHRDLKPVNIFLDVKGRVKIGDFGLATTSLRSRLNDDNPTKSPLDSAKEEPVEESKTGRIGTPFYVAPELNVHSKPVYNEKVDIYSLGIILFEMCHKPPETLMERCAILKQLRHKEIIFPKNFTSSLLRKHEFLIRWLLNHDPSKRPTSLELLQSEHVPPPILEEKKLMDLIRHTLNNPQSKGYKFLVASCFEQKFRLAEDVTYDRDVNNISSPKTLEHYYELVKDITVKVFKKHGAQNLPTPLLLPSGRCYTFHNQEDNCVRLMTNNGDVVVLPYDLRVPFARYIAWNHISLLRRYSIERVYREKKVFGFAPTELYECAFDIVTPTQGSLLSDGEILYIVYEIFTQLPILKNKRITIRLNHKLLVEFILSHYKIKQTDRTKFIQMSHEFRENKLSRNDYSSYLFSLGLTDASVTALTTLISNDYENVTNGMQMIVKRNNTEYIKYVNPAIKDLKKIEQAAKAMGLDFELVFAPGLLYKVQQFSGMICQFVCQSAKRKFNRTEILAVGGRYDRMISDYRDMQRANVLFKEIPQSAVGISISLDKIVQIIQKEELLEEDNIGHFDVMVCTVGSERRLNDKVKIISSLSSAEVRWTFLEAGSMKEIEEYSEELGVPNVIILKDNDEEKVILRSREKERFQEKAYSVLELMDEIPKLVKSSSNNEISLSKSDSRIYVEKSQPSSSVDIVFHTSEKIAVKKRYEIQILNQLNEVSIPLHGEVIVIALDVDISVIKTLVANLEFQTDEIFYKTVESVIEKHSRQKKVLRGICDLIYTYKKKSAKSFLFLYSLKDLACKLIM